LLKLLKTSPDARDTRRRVARKGTHSTTTAKVSSHTREVAGPVRAWNYRRRLVVSTLVLCFDLPRSGASIRRNHPQIASLDPVLPCNSAAPFSDNSYPASCRAHKVGSHLC